MKAIRVHQVGGPEVLQYEDVPPPEPGPGEARVKVEAAGVNFIDIYLRTGQYKATLPVIPGQEGAGVVDAIGAGGSEVPPGEFDEQQLAALRQVPQGAIALGGTAVLLLLIAWLLIYLLFYLPRGMVG